MEQNINKESNRNFSVIFRCLDEAKQSIDFQCVAETMEQSNIISEEIEKLREIVIENEQHSLSIFATT